MSIQLFVPTFEVEECLNEIRECLEKGWTGLGYKTIEFEKRWCEYTGYKHSHFLASATAGLNLALEILKRENNWDDNDEIITTPITFISTNHAILHAKLKPIFADVDETLTLNPEKVVSKISQKTKAILFVGIGGNAGNYSEIKKICDKKGLKLILDAAHMSGSNLHGKTIGLDSDVSVYSFQAVKNLPTADSGMICFNDLKYDNIVRKMTWLGINKDTYSRNAGEKGTYKWNYDVEYVGYKEHGNSIMASLGLVQLRYLDRDNHKRRELSKQYDKSLTNSKHIKLVKHTNESESSRHLYQIIVKKRDSLLEFLNSNDVFPGVHYRNNLDYKMYKDQFNECPYASEISESLISLPLHMRLTNNDVLHVANLVNEFYEDMDNEI